MSTTDSTKCHHTTISSRRTVNPNHMRTSATPPLPLLHLLHPYNHSYPHQIFTNFITQHSHRQTFYIDILIQALSPKSPAGKERKRPTSEREHRKTNNIKNVSPPTTATTINISSNTQTQTLNINDENTKSSSPPPLPRNTPRLQHPQQRRRDPAILRTTGVVRSGSERGKFGLRKKDTKRYQKQQGKNS